MAAAGQESGPRSGRACPITLDLQLCKACGICVAICPKHVYDRDGLGYPAIARWEDCIQCLRCELHCPDFAIEVERRERKKAAAAPARRRAAAGDDEEACRDGE